MTKNDEFDPSTARIISNNKDDEFDPSTAKLSSDTHDPNSRSWGTVASDVGNSIASGAAAAGRGILGLSDLLTGSNSIQNTKNLGLDIKSSEQAWKDNLSEKAKQEEQAWNNTQGFVDTLKYGATHPFAVANKVAESLPAMAVSGGMGGAVAKGVIGGAIGEGMQQAGSSYADAIEKNNGNTPTDKDAGAALGSGVTTATISALSGGLAKKLGIGDIDTAIANRVAGEAATSARPLGIGAYAKNIGEGIITEGALEELPQSATEQMWQNYANGNPIMEGVPEAAAQGLITGGLMGGAFNATNLPTFNESQNDQGNQGGQGQSNGPMPEVLPPDGSNGLPNNVQPNTFDGSYRDLTPSNAPQLTNEQQPESASASSNNTPSSETPMPSDLGLNLLQLNNTTSETPEVQAGNLSPSQELGIDPSQGGLSSAAAVAVDTGASPITAELQRQATQSQPNEQANWLNGIASPTAQNQNEAPQLGYSPSENTNTPPVRQQIADMAVQSGTISDDANTQSSNEQANDAPAIEPILGKDGKNKWFATQNKANEFIQKKSLGDNYTIEQTGKMRYEIVPKPQEQAPTQEPQRTQQERRQIVIDAYNTDNNPPVDAGNYAQQKAKVTIDRVKQQSPSLYEEAKQLAENAEVATNKNNGRTAHYLTFANDDAYRSDPFLGKKPSKDEIMVEALMHVTRDNAPMPPTANNTEATQPKLYGKESYIQTGSERQPTRVAVVEADSLAPDDKNTDNQFRDRTRAASQTQIDSIANNLDPRQLTDSTTMATGSPTLANDGKTIIAGNGRTKAIKQAYAQGKGAEYKQSLIEQAQSLGIDPQQIAGMKNPVLVKEFTNPVDVKKMAIESNATGGLAMSAKEQARADSALMPDMSMLASDDKGNINLSRNAQIFRKFISSLPVEAQASMLDKDGLLSKEGLSRLQNAVLYKAYGDSKAFDDMVENTDVDVKNAINGLTQVAPKIAQTKESINQGTSYDADISEDITAALSLLQQIRKNEMSVSDYLSQMGLFDDGLSPIAKEFIQYIDDNIRSAKAIADLLSAYYDNLDSLGNPNQQDLLGGKPNTNKQSLFKQALEQVRNAKQPKQTTNDLFAEPTAIAAGQPTNQADNAVEQRPSQSQSDGAGVGTNESAVIKNVGDFVTGKNNKQYQITDIQYTPLGGISSISLKLADAKYKDNGKPWTLGEYARYIKQDHVLFTPNETDAKPSDQPSTPQKLSGGLTYVGDNKDGTPLYEDDEGYRVQQVTNGLRNKETSTYTSKGIRPERRADEFLTDQELKDRQSSQPKQTNTKDAIKKIQAGKKAAKKDKEKFADNKVFTADKVAAARARMKSKLSQINSGIDPEMVMDGITITGAYVESGIRKFGDYANAMIEDFGDNIKPYLLSFWESTRHYPSGVDVSGMTSVEDSKKEFDALIAKSDNEANSQQDNTDDNSLRGTPDGRASTTAATGETSQGTLARVPTDNVSPVSKTGNATGQAQPSSRTSVSSDGTTGRSGAQSERSTGNRPAAVYPATARDERVTPEPTQAVTAGNTATDYPIAPPQNQENSQDFTISEDDEVGKGGLKTKFKQNLEAIKLLKQLQSENRQATKDEQKILTKWVGWGGLKAAFRRGDGSTVNGWAKEVEQLEALLTPDELDAALNSTIAAHYTEPKIVKAMWKAVEKLGFNGGRVLEPSIGSGIFLGMLPASLRKSTAFYGTELDTITGGLAQQLYPTAAIKVMGFQDYSLQDGFFKVAIGNPPFANIKITDLERKHLNGLSLHNYFFAKSLDALEDNGVLAMVVTSRLLDGADTKTRDYLFDNAELLMAVRLPNNAFKENANTDVTTDIIFLRKRSEAERINGITNDFDYRGVGKFTDKNGDVVPLNNYFVKNPDHMLGEFGNFGSMYARGADGIETALVAPKGQNTLDLLNKALDKLPTGVIAPRNKSDVLIVESMVKDIPDVKVGSMFEQDGNIYERTPDSMGDRQAVAVELPSQKAIERVKGLIGLRTLLSDVRQMQLSSNTDETVLEQRRAELNKAYDQFVKEHGHINSDANKRLFKEDPSWSQLSALEDNYDKGVSAAVSKNTGEPVKKPSAKKAAILERRTQYPFAEVTQVSSAKDGMIETLNSVGRLDLARISQLYGKDEQAVIKELGDLVYQDPVQSWVTADNYLSGNVKAKLAQAREAMAQYGNDYERNVKALEQVQPEDIEAVDIEVRAGAHWIPANHITDFLKDVLGATGLQGAPTYSKFDNDWTLPKFSESAEAGTQFGTSRKSVRDIVTAAMNGKQITVYDQIDRDTRVVNREATNDANQKVEAVKRAWNDWIWMDDGRRDELARLYNDIFNTDVAQAYDGSHLKLLGKVDDNVIELRPTQKNAIWRITQNPTTLLDHVVGAGKTFTMVAAAMELRRMGLASKPMIVVPNHLVSQWGKEFIQLYPNANILVATKKDFEATNRKRLVARIANGDWDAVIVAHSSFGKIAVSPEFEAEFVKQQIQDISDAIEEAKKEAGKSSNARDLANRKLKLEEKYKKLTASENRDTDNLYWDELGVDALMLDEAHEFKNLAYTTSTMNRVAGLGNQAGSQKAMDLFMKIQQLKQNPSSRIVFATGTPISNSMAEMYTMQRYLDMERMQNQGISGFDAWAKTFGEVINDWELSASGKYQMKSRFAKFVNMPELMQSYLGFADVINRDDINDSLKSQGKKLPVPKIKGGAPQNTVVERSDEQADFIGVPRMRDGREIYDEYTLIYRAEHLPKGQDAKKKGADNMLKIMGEARKAALDMRILDPNAPDFAGSKINVAVGNIMRIWRDTAADKGTQLVFCDLSTPKGSNNKEQAKLNELVRLADEGNEDAIAQLEKYTPDELDAIMNVNSFSVYDDIKQKLINQGIPENEIAFIHDANTELQKDELFSKVRSGRVRVLLGSTSKMGAGTNVQTRLVALHHMDAPWRPSDLEQREGRIIRQGNELYAKDPENFEVEIHRYATEQTMDAMQWQIIENKAKFIEQVRKGDIKTRVIEDIEGEAANAGAMKAAASGNPLILEEMALKKQLNDLDSDKTRHDREQHRIKATIKRTKDGIDSLDNEQSRYTTLSQAKTPTEFDITVNGKNYKQGQEGARTDAGKAIISQAIKASMSKGKLTVGQYGDFTIYAAANPTNRDSAIISLGYQGESISIEVKHNDPAGGIITKLINRIKEIPDKLQQFKTDLEKSIKAIPKLESQLKPWGKEAELDAIRQKHAEVMDALKPKKDGQAQQNQQYSQAGMRIGGTSKQVRQVLSDKFAKAAIDKLIADGNLEIIDYAEAKRRNPKTPSNADGYYADGKAVLIADNLSPDMIIPTFLHELGGHGGLQTLMSDKAYQSLLKEFDRMVAEGNPLASEAKSFAEATSPNAKVAQDEYLPYLISLAARAQGNSKVKSMLSRIVLAVKSFIRDKFGVSFKITPADIVALAEKMVSERAMQGKSIADNTGAFDPNNDDIRYSQMGGNSPQLNKLSKALSEFLKNPLSFIKSASDNKVTDNLGKALAMLGRRQIVDIYKKDLPPLKEYSDIVEQMDADSNGKAYEADKLVKEWGKLKDELPLAELMHDATLKGIDPAEAYQTGDDRAIYQQLRRRYDALSPDAKRIYKQARDDYKAQQRSVFEAIKGRIQRTDMSAPRQAELIRKMEQGFFFGQKVYFPLARFGSYVVAVKDAAGNIVSVSRAETKGQADELRKELIAQYPNDKVGRVMLDKEFVSSRDGVTRGFMSDLFDAVDKLNISSQERAEFEDTLGQLYLNSLPDISFAKSGMHRKGTPGFSQNARRAYAQHMSRGSHYIAKMRHADVLQSLLDDMQDYVKTTGEQDANYDQPKMQRVVDEMEKRHETMMNSHNAGWSSLATSIGFMWYMGLSPASALVNLSQTVLVAYPVMGAKWGFAKAGVELSKASEQAAKALNNLQSSLSGDEKTAFDEAVKRGVIDMTQAHDLAGVARGEDDSVMWKIRKPMEWASFMFHHAEKFNRQVTFIASYRLAKQAGANHKQAIEQAIDATYEGHFSYASSNRPRMMQGDWARVFLLFKQYGQNMVYTLSRNAYLSAKGDKQAMKTLAGMLALHGTFAGILGLPLATTLLGFASALGGDDDEPWDAEIALRNYLAELLGDGASEVISKGLPRALGIDLSSRVGLDSLILPRMQEGLEGQRAGESTLAAFSGPVFGIGVNAMAGISDIQNGNMLIGTEKLLPKAVRDLVKTYRYATEGIVDKTGIEIMPQENVSLNDIGQQVLGFRSAKIAQAQEGKSAIYKMDKEIGKTRQRLMNRYAKAYMAGDAAGAEEAWQDIKRFNAGIGKDYPKLKITKPKLMQSIKQRRRRIEDAEDGIYLPSSREASRQYGSFATE